MSDEASNPPSNPASNPASEFDHCTEEFAQHWRDELAHLRAECPVAHSDAHGGFYAVSRYADVQSVLRDHRTYSSARQLSGEGWESDGGATIPSNTGRLSFMEMDPPESVQYRRLVNPWFSRLAIDVYRPRLRELIGWAFDNVCSKGSAEVVSEIANPVPALVTMDFLGLDLGEWHRYGDAIHSGVRRAPGSGKKLKWMMSEVDAVVERTDLHRDGVIPFLLRAEIDGQRVPHDIVREIVFTLLNGGIDTTTSMIASCVVQIGTNPHVRTMLRDDPSTAPVVIQELLRYCAPSIGVARTAVQDAELPATKICPGDRLLLLVSSANFDEERFQQPDQIDPARRPNPHLSFGFGAHRCLGAELATAELEIVVAELMARMPDFVVDEAGVDPYRTIPLVNGYASVPITFAPVARQMPETPLPVLTAPRLKPVG